VLDRSVLARQTKADAPAAAVVVAPTWRRVLPWALAGVLGVALVVALWASAPWRAAPAPVDPVQFYGRPCGETPRWLRQSTSPFPPTAGTWRFSAGPPGGQPMLWVRPLGTLAARALPGTEQAIPTVLVTG
jgi:hypothetical protein